MKYSFVIFSIVILTQCGQKNDQQLRDSKDQVQNLSLKVNKLEMEKRNLEIELNSLKVERFNNEDFNSFFWQFMTDSSFQINRTRFPLPKRTWLEDLGGPIGIIEIEQVDWQHEWFYFYDGGQHSRVYDNFDLQYGATNERVHHSFGVETGGDAKYFFEGFDGLWYLIKIEQLGD